MDRSLEPVLSGLVPSLVGPLPVELVDLTASLVAQSRNRISSLKPAEEVARVYVCAHIACDRLRKKLDLPTIEPRPPLDKKPYGALYNQFHKALTPASSRTHQQAIAHQQAPIETPSSVSSTSTPVVGVASSALTTVDPEIRAHVITLCQALSSPAAAKHIIAGTVAALKLVPDDKLPRKKNYALPIITAVTLLIIEKLLPDGRTTTMGTAGKWRRGEGYCTKRDGVMKALGNVGKDGFTKEETDGWVKDLSMMGIRELEWLKNVPDQGGIKKRKADVTEKYDRQLQEEIMAVKIVNRIGRKRVATRSNATAIAEVEKHQEIAFAPAPVAPMVPAAPAAPVAPVAPMAPTTLAAPTAPTAPMAPVALMAPVTPVAPVAPMTARTPRTRTGTEPKPKMKEKEKEKGESGIGTMMQDRVDYLNPKKRKIFAGWKDTMLERCNEVEKEQQGQTQAVRV